MRIDSHPGAQPLPENQSTNHASSARPSASITSGGSSALGEDQAQVSGAQVQVQALVAQVLQLPETALNKVQALRQAVAAGNYKPTADQVAKGLFSNLLKVAA